MSARYFYQRRKWAKNSLDFHRLSCAPRREFAATAPAHRGLIDLRGQILLQPPALLEICPNTVANGPVTRDSYCRMCNLAIPRKAIYARLHFHQGLLCDSGQYVMMDLR